MASLTYANIETRVMNQLRIPTGNATEQTKVAALINEVMRDIGMRYPNWWWLKKRQVINTSDDISTGTLNVSNGSTSITFSTGPTPSVAGRVLLVTSDAADGAVYRIATHTAGATAATLDAAYTGTTNTAASYVVYHDQYDLATDTGKLLHVNRYGYTWPVEIIRPDEIKALKAYDTSVGKPQVAALLDFDTSGDPTTQKQLIVHPYPDATYRMEIDYTQTLNTELSGSTRPLIPDDYVQILIYGSLARGYPIFLNDTERGAYFQGLFNDVLALMVATQRQYEGGHPQIRPVDSYRRFYHRGRRISPGTADLGSFFDRWPNNP